MTTNRMTRRKAGALAALLAVAGWSHPALAQQDWPGDKPIRLVVPYPAGGTADTIARIVGEKMAALLGAGAVVVVDNKSGASGTLGALDVLRAPADGRSLLLTVTSQLTNSNFNVKPGYDAVKDFTPIVGLTLAPMALAVRQDMPVTSLADFDKLARSRPMAYGTYGVGTSAHVMLAGWGRELGVKFVHAPYRGETALVTDLLGGQIDFGLLTIGVARDLQQAGKVKLLATVGPERSPFVKNLPTFAEQGVRGFDWTFGVGLYASSKLPPELVARLEKLGRAVVAAPDVQAKFRQIAAQPWGAGSEEMKKRLVIDSVLWDRTAAKYGKLE